MHDEWMMNRFLVLFPDSCGPSSKSSQALDSLDTGDAARADGAITVSAATAPEACDALLASLVARQSWDPSGDGNDG